MMRKTSCENILSLLLFVLLFVNMSGCSQSYREGEISSGQGSKNLFLEHDDIVRSCDPTEEGYEVTFEHLSAYYYLRNNNNIFDEILTALQYSQENKLTVSLGVNPLTMEIMTLALPSTDD